MLESVNFGNCERACVDVLSVMLHCILLTITLTFKVQSFSNDSKSCKRKNYLEVEVFNSFFFLIHFFKM